MHNQTFDNFIKSESNKYALNVIDELFASIKYGTHLNPLLIYSKTSNGKTHLLHAIKHKLESEYPMKTVKYISPDLFRNEVTKHISADGITNRILSAIPRLNLHEFDFLLIDEFQKFPLRERLLKVLSLELQKGLRNGQQLIIASTYIPQTYWAIMETMSEIFKKCSIITLYNLHQNESIIKS
ncbi:MAG TPA: DnaA/Hda family protein [Flavobacterium sp.]|nr:DnaA/Hda family protein [Flavobacterium sp.]